MKAKLQSSVQRLAADGIFIGTSSWKYDGWLGTIFVNNRLEGNALETISAMTEGLG